MALGSGIEWTESTWNPVTGCDRVSPGCKYCYAERMAKQAGRILEGRTYDAMPETTSPSPIARSPRAHRSLGVMG